MRIMPTLCLIALAGQASALSCIRPDAASTFNRVNEAPEPYAVLYGTLTFDETALPPPVSELTSPDPEPIAATFVGKGLTQDGFTADYSNDIILDVGCAGPWCGAASSGVEAVYFVRTDQTPPVAFAEPCGGMIFETPTQAVLDTLTACINGQECSAQALQ